MNETIPYENSDDGEEGRGRRGTVTNVAISHLLFFCKTISTRSMRRDIRTGGGTSISMELRADHDSLDARARTERRTTTRRPVTRDVRWVWTRPPRPRRPSRA